MKTKLKIKLSFLFLFVFFLIGLFNSSDAFAVNYSTFNLTFTNNGNANSWVDYLIFEDRTLPRGGNFNSGDTDIAHTGSTGMQVLEGVNVPAGSSVTVTVFRENYPPGDVYPIYAQYMPWKYENPAQGDSGCVDPVASLTTSVSDVQGSNIFFTFSTSRSYTCNVPIPKGNHDDANCTSTWGWTCDHDNFSRAVTVHLYVDGPSGTGTGYDIGPANVPREAGVANACGGNANHGFNWTIPDSLKNNAQHSIYAYAIDAEGRGNPLLSGSPKYFTCAPNYVRIQGYKVLMPGNNSNGGCNPLVGGAGCGQPWGATVLLDGNWGDTENPYGTNQPLAYSAWNTLLPGTNYTVSVPALAGYSIGYSLCYNVDTCHGTVTPGNSVTVNIPSSPANGYADLWWHYTPISTPTPAGPAPLSVRLWKDDDSSGTKNGTEQWIQTNAGQCSGSNYTLSNAAIKIVDFETLAESTYFPSMCDATGPLLYINLAPLPEDWEIYAIEPSGWLPTSETQSGSPSWTHYPGSHEFVGGVDGSTKGLNFGIKLGPTPTAGPTPTTGSTPTPTPTTGPTPTQPPTYTISGDVYIDNNGNGIKDGPDTNYQGAVYLRTGSCIGTLINNNPSTSLTSPGYSFPNLVNGTTYYIIFTRPTGYKITAPTSPTLCSSSNYYVTKTISGSSTTQNWGIQLTNDVFSGTVFLDTGAGSCYKNGIQDCGEAGIPNNPVTIADSSLVPRWFGDTNSSGYYSFQVNSSFCQCQISSYIPEPYASQGYVWTTTHPVQTFPPATVNFGIGPPAPTHSISGIIFIDDGSGGGTPNDGIINGTESPYSGASVSMSVNGGASSNRTLITGAYTISGFTENQNHILNLTVPSGYSYSYSGTNANYVNPRTVTVPTADVSGVNFGIVPYSISGNVFIDSDNDCVKDAGESNYADATINKINPPSNLGYDVIGSGGTQGTANRMRASKLNALDAIQMAQISQVTQGRAYLRGGTIAGTVYMVIYNDSAGLPGNLLAVSNGISVAAGRGAQWDTFTFPAITNIPTSTLWLGIYADSTGTTAGTTGPMINYSTSVVGNYASQNSRYVDVGDAPVPNSFGASTANPIQQSWSAYLIVPQPSTSATSVSTSPGFIYNNLSAGTYDISLTVPNGYTSTCTNPISRTVPPVATDVNFGIRPIATPTPIPAYQISGNVYIDTNNNGVKDGAEVNYTATNVNLQIDSVTSGFFAGGVYGFTQLAGNSNHTVLLNLPSGYMLSFGGASPNTNPRPVSVLASDVSNVNFGIVPSCVVTTSPASLPLTVGGTGTVTASVTSGLGSATINQMRFGSYNTSIATVSPASDNSSPYSTTVTAVAAGSTAVWATADLSDGRTCQSSGTTDTDTTVSTPTSTPTPTLSPGTNLTVMSVTTDKTNYAPGEAMVITPTVRNTSVTNITSSFQVAVYRNGGATQPACSSSGNNALYTLASLNSGVSNTNPVNVLTVPTTPGTYRVGIFVDYGCTITESIENSGLNNGENYLLSAPYNVVAPTYSISGNVYIDTNNNGVKDAGEVNYTATVPTIQIFGLNPTTNTGGAYSFTNLSGNWNYEVELTVPSGYILSNSGNNPNFNPRSVPLTNANVSNINFGIISTTACPAGQINPHSACSGSACVITTGCGPNTCTTNADCPAVTPTLIPSARNLIITSVTTDKSSYTPVEPMTITYTVKNTGSLNAGGFAASYTRDGPTTQTSCPFWLSNPISALAAGASYTISIPFNAPTILGTYRAGAYADDNPCNQIAESNETDNYNYSTPYTVAAASTYSISGSVFIDNGAGDGIANNGVKDGSEPLWTAGTELPLTIRIGATNTSTVDGNYSFSNLAGNSSYNVQLVTLPNGYILSNNSSNPNTNPRSVPITDSSRSGINFGIILAPTYPVGGDIFVDDGSGGGNPGNGVRDGTEPTITDTTTVEVRPGGTICTGAPIASATESDGTFSFSVPAGTYDVCMTSPPVGWEIIDPTTSPPFRTVTVGPASPAADVDFAVLPYSPWIQSKGTNIRDDNYSSLISRLDIKIPSTAKVPPATAGVCTGGFGDGFTSVSGAGGSPGIIFTGDTAAEFGAGSASAPPNNWRVGSFTYQDIYTPSKGYATSYSYVLGRVKQGGITTSDLPCGAGRLNDCTVNTSIASGVYKADGNLTITSFNGGAIFPASSAKKLIILVNGNLYIKSNIIVPLISASTLTFIVKGDIHIDPSIGTAWNSSTIQIEGFYSADKNFYLDGNPIVCTNTTDRLNMRGSIIVNAGGTGGSFINNRTLCTNNAVCPVFTISERPDFILNAPESIKQIKTIYQEVAP